MTNKYKKEYIDLKEINKLVPDHYRHKINLLFNKDIPKEPKNPDELMIYRFAQLTESQIQQAFHTQFNTKAIELKKLNRFNELEFVQNDNGDSAGGQLTQIQRITLYRRKKAEGSRAGFPDIAMLYFCANLNLRDVFYCEVKKIGAPSEIRLTREQLDWFIKLNDMGFNSYITNNPLFFNNVILKKISEMFE